MGSCRYVVQRRPVLVNELVDPLSNVVDPAARWTAAGRCSNANDVGKERSSEQATVPWSRLAGQATSVLLAERPAGVYADTVSRNARSSSHPS